MTFNYKINNCPENTDLTVKIKTECGEKILFYINKNSNKIDSIKFINHGSQLISYCANAICKTLSNSKIISLYNTKKNIWQNIDLKLIGSRKEIIENIIKELVAQIQNFS
jgi:hypothetical protein